MSIHRDPIAQEQLHRLHKTLEFIETHLQDSLSLEQVAAAGHYSPYHFHRLFRALVGEPLNQYIQRRRLEHAAGLLIREPDLAILDIALQCGFKEGSSFHRAFKKHFDCSPSDFRNSSHGRYSKIRRPNSKNGQVGNLFEPYLYTLKTLKDWINMNGTIRLVERKATPYVGIDHHGVQGLEAVYERLIQWAAPQGLLQAPDARLMRIFYDSFKTTASHQVRMRIALTTNETVTARGEINPGVLPAQQCIQGHFEIVPSEFEQAWSALYVWMNEQGHRPADAPPFEMYHNDFRTHPEGKCIVDLYIPIA
ncbi:AraC family transcriptional regulator [Croceiramulus getboli]|nr:AraC family transcriptional regulator [Flavobacteriaceae bacterium YJPT1-3]